MSRIVTVSACHLSKALWDLRVNDVCTDLELVCNGGGRIRAHAAVLALRLGRRWRDLLVETGEVTQIVVHIPDLATADVLEDLHRIYVQPGKAGLLTQLLDETDRSQLVLGKARGIIRREELLSDSAAQRLTGGTSSDAGATSASTKTEFSCQKCKKSFARKKDLYGHAIVHRPEKWKFTCKDCDRKFMTNRLLRMHCAREHAVAIQCQLCPKTFSSDSNLLTHVKNLHRRVEVPCEICGKVLASQANLRVHLQKHNREGPDFKVRICPTCGKAFRGRYFYQHVKLHRPEAWRHECGLCGTKFQSKYKKLEHEAVHHTGRKPIACAGCGKLFATTAARAKHIKLCRQLTQAVIETNQTEPVVAAADMRALPLVLPHAVPADDMALSAPCGALPSDLAAQ